MKLVKVTIRKPMYGNYVYINGTFIDKAIRAGAMMEITVPAGKAVVDPKKWKANGKIMKKVFRIPDHPMILYGGEVPVPGKGSQNKLF
jgi:uncharacterized protein YcgI (DUF1989 family)